MSVQSRQSGCMTVQTPTPFPLAPRFAEQVSFDRRELQAILAIYGRMVAAGEWRDYAIACLADVAVFSIFRRTGEHPLYRVEKRPRLRARQGMFALIGTEGHVVKRGHALAKVLQELDRKLIRAVD